MVEHNWSLFSLYSTSVRSLTCSLLDGDVATRLVPSWGTASVNSDISYVNVESQCCTPETNTALFANFALIKTKTNQTATQNQTNHVVSKDAMWGQGSTCHLWSCHRRRWVCCLQPVLLNQVGPIEFTSLQLHSAATWSQPDARKDQEIQPVTRWHFPRQYGMGNRPLLTG